MPHAAGAGADTTTPGGGRNVPADLAAWRSRATPNTHVRQSGSTLLLSSTTDVVNNNLERRPLAPPSAGMRVNAVAGRKLMHKSAIGGATIVPLREGDRAARRRIDRGTLDGHLGYFIRRFQVWVFQDFIRTMAGVEIRPAQYSVLTVIGANPGLSQADLAQALGIERARLVRMLDKLERRGLTERKASARDRRSHALHLTREGEKLLRQVKALAAQHEARLADRLGIDNHRTMIEILRRFEA